MHTSLRRSPSRPPVRLVAGVLALVAAAGGAVATAPASSAAESQPPPAAYDARGVVA